MEKFKTRLLPLTAIVLATLVSLFVLFTPRYVAHANSAAPAWYCGGITGSLLAGDECPLNVIHEDLTFNIPTLPSTSSSEVSYYNGNVRAQYTFYNPEDYDVTARMLFPFGTAPDYYSMQPETFDEIALSYDVTVNGAPVETHLRHSYAGYTEYFYYEFNTFDDIGRLSDEYVEDDFFTPQTPVTKYTYTTRGTASNYYQWVHALCSLGNVQNAYVISDAGYHYNNCDYDENCLSTIVYNGISINIFIIGERPENDPVWRLYSDGSYETEVHGEMALTNVLETTFEELALSLYSDNSTVSETDWYNAVVYSINNIVDYTKDTNLHWFLGNGLNVLDVSSSLMRWYEYEMTVPARSTVTNAVTAPIYPSVSAGNYYFTYLLSPASSWQSFGTLDITINTPYNINACYTTNGEYNKNVDLRHDESAEKYTASLNGLPIGDLYFSIRVPTQSNGLYDFFNGLGYFLGYLITGFQYSVFDPLLSILLLFITSIAIVAIICAIVIPVSFAVHKRRINKNSMPHTPQDKTN